MLPEHVKRFDNWTDYLRYVQTEPDFDREHWNSTGKDAKRDKTFTGGVTFAEAITLASTGWQEGRALVEAQSLRIQNAYRLRMGEPETRQIVRSVAGFMPDIPSYLAGVPDQMFTFVNVPDTHPIVKIVVSMAISAGVESEAISARGATVAALVDILESTGRRCEVVLVHRVQGEAIASEYVTVKHAQDALQIDQLAFAIAHPASVRYLRFRSQDLMPHDYRRALRVGEYAAGYGTPIDAPIEEQGDIYIGKMHYDTFRNPENWIENQLRRQGVIE